MNHPPKVLLVTKNNQLEKLVKKIFDGSVNLEIVNTVDMAIEKILANGFSLTILDYKMDYPESINPEDLIKLNHVACKGLIILGDASFERRVKKTIGTSLTNFSIWRVDTKNVELELIPTFRKVMDINIPTQQEMFNSIMSDIQDVKNGLIYRISKFIF